MPIPPYLPRALLVETIELARSQASSWMGPYPAIQAVAAATGRYNALLDDLAPIVFQVQEEFRDRFFDRMIELVKESGNNPVKPTGWLKGHAVEDGEGNFKVKL